MAISTKSVPVEAHWSVGLVERAHPTLRRAYQVISEELQDTSTKELTLQMAVKAVNDTASPDGLVPTLLVFGAYPRMTKLDPPAPSITVRAMAIRKAMTEITKLRARKSVNNALHHRNGPDTTPVHDLPLNSEVLVWREGNTGQSGKWTGPYTLLALEGETCKVQLPRGPTDFRSTTVKPYLRIRTGPESEPESDIEEEQPVEQPSENTILPPPKPGPGRPRKTPLENTILPPVKRGRGRPRKHPLPATDTSIADISIFVQDTLFENSRRSKINGLLKKGVFEPVNIEDVPQGVRIFNSRFVDKIKHPGTNKAFEKSRLVVQAYNDQGKDLVLT